MSNDYYVSSGVPATSSSGSSALVRAQFANVEDGFDKLPTLSGNGSKAVIINAGATGLGVTTGTLALAGDFATAGAYAVTLTATGATGLTLPTTGTLATTSNKLSAFAATTSAELAGVVSDETGTGALVFANTPTLVTPVLGVATATSINKMAITAPATGSTLAVADGKTLTANKTLTFDGTDGTTMTFPATSATLARTDAANTFTGVQTMTSPAFTTPAFTGAFSGTYSLGGTPTINVAAAVGGTWTAAATWTLPAHTLGGTVSGSGNQINNVVIGASTPLAGTFTTATANAFVPNSASVPTNGMYLSAANTLAWATNSTLAMSLSSAGALLTTGSQTVSNTFPKMILKRSNSATAYGSLDFVGSDDAVDWQIATNNAIGSQGFEINGADGSSNFLFLAPTTGYLKVIGVYSQTSGSAANVVVDSSGNVMRSTSTLSKKILRDDLTLAEARQAALGNRALRYTMKDSLDKVEYVGYGAELVAEKDSRFVTFDKDGKPDGVQYASYVVPHGMILDDHESRLTQDRTDIAALIAGNAELKQQLKQQLALAGITLQ